MRYWEYSFSVFWPIECTNHILLASSSSCFQGQQTHHHICIHLTWALMALSLFWKGLSLWIFISSSEFTRRSCFSWQQSLLSHGNWASSFAFAGWKAYEWRLLALLLHRFLRRLPLWILSLRTCPSGTGKAEWEGFRQAKAQLPIECRVCLFCTYRLLPTFRRCSSYLKPCP